jgi:hypothetical protein
LQALAEARRSCESKDVIIAELHGVVSLGEARAVKANKRIEDQQREIEDTRAAMIALQV